VLLGCGLRRRELTELTTEHFQRREDHWAIVDLIAKEVTFGLFRCPPGLNKQLTIGWLRQE